MTLTPGTRLGVYEITAQIGEGGMGQVFRATDTKLKRQVAIKILPPSLAADPERMARFQREAEVLASLNHPNIAIIHGLEDADGVKALVMELVEGEDLSQRIALGAIPIDEALPIAKQIAEALEAAHEQGIIHRDLKPANIKVRADGTVKVLDFGLAKALDSSPGAIDVSQSPTITSPAMTQMGVILGTAAYMSPEQAKGKAVGKRADIWAFGCVLYEMLTGTRAFRGETVSETLAFIMMKEPNWSALPSSISPAITKLIRRCLEKDPKRRLPDIGVARLEIDEAQESEHRVQTPPTLTSRPSRWRRAATLAATLLVGSALAGIAVWLAMRRAPQPVTRFTLSTSGDAAVAIDPNDRAIAVAPDGSKVAYTGASATVYGAGVQSSLFVRAFDQLQPTLLAGPGGVREPFFSTDGAWVGFFEPVIQLQKVPTAGGTPVPLAMLDSPSRGATWGTDDTIVYATINPATGLLRISANGGEPTVLTRPNPAKGERDHFWPHVLPGGRAVLFTIVPPGPIEDAQIAVLDLRGGSQKIVLRGGSDARYVEGGYLVYGLAGTLRAVAFDVDRLEARGTPVPVLQQVVTTPTAGAANFAVAANGTLTYISGGELGETRTLVWVDRAGREEPLKVPPRAYASARLSPDGSRIALDVRDEQNDIWIWDLQRQTMTRLTFDPGADNLPTWTPDGRRIVFVSSRDGGAPRPYWQAADGTGAAELLTSDSIGAVHSSFSPDGTRLLISGGDVGVLTVDGARRMELLLKGAYLEVNAEVSPDGRWLAYQSNESGRDEIYVRPFPNVDGGKWQVSADGGTRPLWARDGRELFYYTAARGVIAVPIRTGTTFAAGTAAVVFGAAAYSVPTLGRTYDVSADGRRFLMIKQAPPTGERAAASLQLVVVQHWIEELKRLVPTK